MTYRPSTADGSPMPIRDYFARANARKAKRAEKGLALGLRKPSKTLQDAPGRVRTPVRGVGQRTAPISRLSDRGALKAQIVRLLGLLDRKYNGPLCRFHKDHRGDTACHIVPQQRGDAARFLPENVYWGCRAANYGEVRNRSLYRQYHIDIFGKDRVEAIEEIARTKRQYTTAELIEMRNRLRRELELR